LAVILAAALVAAMPARAQDAVPVVAVLPTPSDNAPPLRLSGTVTSARFAALSPRVDGLVIKADADEGHVAKRGEALVTLDATLAKIEAGSARARLAEARALLEDTRRLQAEAERLGQNIPKSTLETRSALVRINTAVVARLEAELALQLEIIERHVVLAPFDGVVVDKLTEVGEWADSGRPVLEFLATDNLRLDVQAPQSYYPIISRAKAAMIRLDAFPDDLFTGQVTAIVPASDPDARTFLVRLLLDNPSNEVISGMSAEASFSVSDGSAVLEIPRDAVKRYPDGSTSVWVVEKDGDASRAHERQVKLVRSFGEMVKVVSGLDGALPVVVRGNEGLDDGDAVRLMDRLPGGDAETDTGN
jgi:RND family efflux transporter MFP subunit